MPEPEERYSRQVRFAPIGAEGQARLAAASVTVVGCGALGSLAASYLARAGVGRLRIVDRDLVEESNLQRQILFVQDDVDRLRPKASAAAAHLRRANPAIEVEERVADVSWRNAADLIGRPDLIVDGTDNFATRYLVNDAAVILNKPYVWGSIYRFEGQVSVFWAQEGPQYRDLYPEPQAAATELQREEWGARRDAAYPGSSRAAVGTSTSAGSAT